MPGARVFIDTNVLLYLHDKRDPAKSLEAIAWVRALATRQAARTNLQILNELMHVLLRKRWLKSPEEVFRVADGFAEFGDSHLTASAILAARRIHLSTYYSWWDCLLLASALELGCTHFLSEDLQDGQQIESLTIVDPFAHSPDQILISR